MERSDVAMQWHGDFQLPHSEGVSMPAMGWNAGMLDKTPDPKLQDFGERAFNQGGRGKEWQRCLFVTDKSKFSLVAELPNTYVSRMATTSEGVNQFLNGRQFFGGVWFWLGVEWREKPKPICWSSGESEWPAIPERKFRGLSSSFEDLLGLLLTIIVGSPSWFSLLSECPGMNPNAKRMGNYETALRRSTVYVYMYHHNYLLLHK